MVVLSIALPFEYPKNVVPLITVQFLNFWSSQRSASVVYGVIFRNVRFPVHILLLPAPGFRAQPSRDFLTLWTYAPEYQTSYLHHISNFLTTVWLLLHCFHPETSFVVNLWFCNADPVGTLVFHKVSLVKSVRFPDSFILTRTLLQFSRKFPKHHFQGGYWMPIKVIQKVGEGGQTKIGWLWIQEEGVDFLVFWRKSQMNDPFV